MTPRDDLDRVLGDWLAEGPVRTPEPVLATALQHARSHPRRPDPLGFLRRDPMAARMSLSGVAPVPVFAALTLLVAAAMGVALVGGQRGEPPPPSPMPTSAPTPSPTPSPLPSPIRVGLQTSSAATMTVDVLDETGLLVDARTAPPAEGGSQPEGTVGAVNVDERTVRLTWTDAVCDAAYDLTIEGIDTMTLTVPPCVGDTMAMDRGLLLQFAEPVDAAAIRVRVVEP